MTVEELENFFETHSDNFLKFKDILPARILNNRPDINAFILLDKLVPANRNIVCSASHDEIYLDVELEDLAKLASEADLLDLIRSGVRIDDYGLCMFV